MTNPVSRQIAVKVLFQWDGSNWTDETQYVISMKGTQEYFPPNESYQSGRQIIQQASVTLANLNYRFSPWNSDSVLYSQRAYGGSYHRKCRMQIQEDGGSWVDLFFGYVKTPGDSFGRNQVTFTIWDIGEILREKKSTAMLENYQEHDLVIYYLSNVAGRVDGVDFISPNYAAAHGGTPTIDYSPLKIPYSWLDEEQIWDELVDVAQASGSRIYVDPAGMIHFEKGWRWPILGAGSAETITEDDYKDWSFSYDDKAFYDKIIVNYTPRSPGNGFEELWLLQKPKLVLPGATEVVTAKFKWPSHKIVAPVANTHYHVTSLNGQDKSGTITPAFEIYAQNAKVTITNTLAYPIVLSKLKFLGQPLMAAPQEQVEKIIGDGSTFQRPFEVKSNMYIQSKAQATGVRDFLAWWYQTAKPSIKVTGLRGKSARTLGDRFTVKAANKTLDGIAIRIGWQATVKEQSIIYTQELTLIENVFASDSYFIIGTDTLGGSKKVWH